MRARLAAFLLLAFQLYGVFAASSPNVILIMADDLGYGELGCYGQKEIRTPNLDRMAAEGIKFTRFYAGSTVCAPSRSVLMTGQHVGRTRVRGNAGAGNSLAQMLRDGDVTVAEVLKEAGYRTGLVGKWGLGLNDEGHPNKQGFEYFYGFLSQVHAHNYYPDFLWRNSEKVPLKNVVIPMGREGAGYATKRVEYAGDLFAEEAIQFLERNQTKPFFLYLAVTQPHANNERNRALGDGAEVPNYGLYEGKDWPPQLKGHAAMITRMDADIGRLIEKLKGLQLTNTIVFFTSDNGPHKESGHDPNFFDPNGPLRGFKRDLTDGGIRVPLIAWWPGRIKAGSVSEHVCYGGDIMATVVELARVRPPKDLNSISLVPTLLGKGRQKKHPYLYWEFHEGGSSQAVLIDGRWKGIRMKRRDAPLELYDLRKDVAEERNVAEKNRRIVRRVEELFRTARTESEDWQMKDPPSVTNRKRSP